MTTIYQLLISLLVLLLISHGSAYFWRRLFSGKKYSLIVFPGVILHELSHLFACIITLAKVKKVKLFSMKGGYVLHKKPKLPLIGSPIISFFPVLGGVFFLLFIYRVSGINLPDPEVSVDFFIQVRDLFLNNWQNYIFWAVVYLSVSIIITMTPSKKDFKNSIFNLVVIFLLLIFLIELGILGALPGSTWLIGSIWFSGVVGFFALIFGASLYLIKLLLLKVIRG